MYVYFSGMPESSCSFTDSYAIAQFVYNLTGGDLNGNVSFATAKLEITPALTGNTPDQWKDTHKFEGVSYALFCLC